MMAPMTNAPYVFDGHNDLPWAMRELCGYDLERVDLAAGEPELQTDIPRLRAGGVGAQFWSVFVPCRITGVAAVTATLEQIDFVRRMVARHPDHFAMATTADEVEAATSAGRIASLMGMEGGHSIDGSLGTLRMMHALGVRYLTLTHNENVAWADSATDVPVLGGLSDFGRDIVSEMNRLGMFVDLSHVSADVMRDALDATNAPVIFSHSGARAVCDNVRNVPDEVLDRLRGNGGVCMVPFVPMFVSQKVADWYAQCLAEVERRGGDRRNFADVNPVLIEQLAESPRCTVDDVADHLDHVREVTGIHHVGLGGDYDGAAFFPENMADVSSYPLLFDTLRARSWSESDLTALGHGNVLRAMRDMQQPAAGHATHGAGRS
ncbi:MAG: membrane dipeptidase [Nocardioidaceae bacterium]|nr:membrane dipeptidase [Nocardioidaceae bacterium]